MMSRSSLTSSSTRLRTSARWSLVSLRFLVVESLVSAPETAARIWMISLRASVVPLLRVSVPA